MRLIDFFDRGASLDPDRLFVSDAAGARTYHDAQRRSFRIANALLGAGLVPEGKAAVYSPNSGTAFECILGIIRAGGAWVPINARNVVEENAYILSNCDVEYLFYHSEFGRNIEKISSICPNIRKFICIDGPSKFGTYLEDWIRTFDDSEPKIEDRNETVATVFSSGGTTGRPKGVIWTNQTWETLIANFYAAMPPKKSPVHLVVAPMTHAAGVVAMMLMASGATNVILPNFDAELVLQAIAKHKVTHLFLPPTAIYALLAHPCLRDYDYSSLDYFIYAAAPMSVERLKECLSVFGPVMAQTFGQAEAPMLCTFLSPADHQIGDPVKERRLASCGRPTLLTPVAIMDDDGNILPEGERGEIVVRGNLVTPGYYKNPDETRKLNCNGWRRTGDVGFRDKDNYIYIVDRKRDMIISGGFNIYPNEIEQVIWGHSAVQDCAVIGVPDLKWGEAVKAVIELKPGATVSEEEIIRLCKEKVGSVKAPKTVEFWDVLPRSPVGKVRKKDIREVFWAGHTRQI